MGSRHADVFGPDDRGQYQGGEAAEVEVWKARYEQQKQRGDSLETALDSAEAALAVVRSSGSAAQNHEWSKDESDAMERALLVHLDEDDAMTAIQILRPWLAPRSPQDEDHEHTCGVDG